MAKPETAFRNRIRNNIKNTFLVMQIESGETAPGVPDTHILKRGTNETFWIELKVEKKQPNKIGLRRSQVIWHRRYAREGGDSFIVLYIQDVKAMVIWNGCHAKELCEGRNIYELPHSYIPNCKDKWIDFMNYFYYM